MANTARAAISRNDYRRACQAVYMALAAAVPCADATTTLNDTHAPNTYDYLIMGSVVLPCAEHASYTDSWLMPSGSRPHDVQLPRWLMMTLLAHPHTHSPAHGLPCTRRRRPPC
jgi:hypothetical protein